MAGTDYCASPVAHENIVAILETIGTGAITDTLLTLLQLFKKSEISGY